MKTGLIYCPKHDGLKSQQKRWRKIADALARHEVEYDLVQSESASSVERLVTMMIHNGYDTIIICGGDGALCEAINCLMREERELRERVVLGVIPNGVMNDFASFWGITEKDVDHAAESIKARRIRKVDAGCLSYIDRNGEKSNRYFLNCVDIGLISGIQSLRQKARRIVWSRKLAYLLSLLMLVFQRMFWRVEYTINYEQENHRIVSMCIGSALGFGQTPNAVPYNGMIDVTVVRHSAINLILSGIGLFLRGRILNAKQVIPYRCHDITFKIPKNMPISVDGHAFPQVDPSMGEMKISVEQECVKFIIEK